MATCKEAAMAYVEAATETDTPYEARQTFAALATMYATMAMLELAEEASKAHFWSQPHPGSSAHVGGPR